MSTPNRPVGALCVHCVYRPARPHARYPHIATNWCSDRCKIAGKNDADNARAHRLANDLRTLLGLPADRGRWFTAPELAAILRRMRRLLPYDGLAMHPAQHHKRVDYKDTAA